MDKGNMEKKLIQEYVDKYLAISKCSEEIRRGYAFHLNRFKVTLDSLKLLNLKGKVLEIGGYDAISGMIRGSFPDAEYSNTSFELRKPFPLPSDTYDFVINSEVIEHISDVDLDCRQAFYFTGATDFLKECRRVLKPGGVMWLSTPNSASYVVLEKILNGDNPWLYFLHYKEYTVPQVEKMVKEAGFKIKSISTEFAYILEENYSKLKEICSKFGYSVKDRGDIIFVEAVK